MATNPTATRHLTEVDRALAGKTPSEQIEILVQELTGRLTADSVAWAVSLGSIADRNDLEPHVVRRCVAELARRARERGQRLPNDREKRLCRDSPNPSAARRALAYAHGHRLRLDLKFTELAELTPRWLAAHPQDALLRSLDTFAALGVRDDRAGAALDRIATLPDFDSSCRAVCLHGLWFGAHLPDQPARIVMLSDEMITRGEDDPDLYYWRGYALRRLGRFEEALASVDHALALLPVASNGSHEAYSRERALINEARRLDEQIQQYESGLRLQAYQVSDQLREQYERTQDQQLEQFRQQREELRIEAEQHSDAARRIVSDSLLGIVEVLALFAVLISVLVGLLVLALRADQLGQSLALLGGMLAAAAGIFWAMRAAARRDRRRRARNERSGRSPVHRLAEYFGFRSPSARS